MYSFDLLPDRRNSDAVKWNQTPGDTIAMWVADMDFCIPPAIEEAVKERASHLYYGYPNTEARLKELVSAHYKKTYDVELPTEWIVQVSSVMTSTGYATTDFNLWPQFSRMIMVCIMFIGACAGSTGGGIKVSRIMIYVKQVKQELMQQIHPRQISVIKMDGKGMDHTTIRSCNVFLMSFILIYAISLLLISLNGFNFTTSFTAVSATLNNIGPGLDMVGPCGSFAEFSDFSKYVLMFDMLAGRLEIIPMLILFHPAAWRKQ